MHGFWPAGSGSASTFHERQPRNAEGDPEPQELPAWALCRANEPDIDLTPEVHPAQSLRIAQNTHAHWLETKHHGQSSCSSPSLSGNPEVFISPSSTSLILLLFLLFLHPLSLPLTGKEAIHGHLGIFSLGELSI